MSLTNTKQCMRAKNGMSNREGSCDTRRGNRNGDRGNSRFTNSSLTGEVKVNRISHLSITKDGSQSIQLTKILKALLFLCQDNHYDYISNIISTNIEPKQAEFLSDHSIKRRRQSNHHVKPGVVEPIIGLNVTSGNIPINSEMVEVTPISNMNPQASHHYDHSEG